MSALHAQLLAAHTAGDTAELSRLYHLAAQNTQDPSAKRFFLTQAYVFALDAGLTDAGALRRALIDLGAEPAG